MVIYGALHVGRAGCDALNVGVIRGAGRDFAIPPRSWAMSRDREQPGLRMYRE